METQACIAEPADSRRLIVQPSTQSPMEMHQTTAMALGVEYHRIEFRSLRWAAALAARPNRRVSSSARRPWPRTPLKSRCVLPCRAKRTPHDRQAPRLLRPVSDRRRSRRAAGPKTKASSAAFRPRCGETAAPSTIARSSSPTACSSAPTTPIRSRNFENQIDVCRTNTAPSTAFRAFGDVQARTSWRTRSTTRPSRSDMLPEDVREKNLYQRGDVTPFGQALSDCYIREVWAYLKEKCQLRGEARRGRRVQPEEQVAQARPGDHPGEVRLRLQPGAA